MTGIGQRPQDCIKITVLGDSLALPRPGDGVGIDDIYPTLLAAQENMIVFNRSKGSADTAYFLESEPLYGSIRYANSDVFIIHLGICDCSPRLFTKREKTILNFLTMLPLTSQMARGYIGACSRKRMYHTRKRLIQNVNLEDFEKNLRRIVSEIQSSNPVRKIFILNIAAPGSHLTERSHGIHDFIKAYNQVIARMASDSKGQIEMLDVYGMTVDKPDYVLPDGHHITAQVHDQIFDALLERVRRV